MEDEIDLRQYIRLLIRHWYWIVGVGLAAAGLAFAVSSLQPAMFEAGALVAITGPRYRMQFDARIQDVPFDPRQFAKGYADIATSSDVLEPVLEQADSGAVTTLPDLGRMVGVAAVGDGNLLQMTVRLEQPDEAARVANLWADSFIQQINSLYGRKQDLSQLETQVAQAKLETQQTDQALAQVRRDSGMGYRPSAAPDVAELPSVGLVFQLQDRTRRLADYEARAARIAQLLEEAQTVADSADGSAPAVVSGLLADMLGLGLFSGGSLPVVQINLGEMDARASATALVVALQAKQAATQRTIDDLGPQVTALQSVVAQRQMELEQLLREQDLTESTYRTLSSKLQESRIEWSGDIARIASRAVTPQEPIGRGRLFTALIAAVVGGMLSILVVFCIEYWRQGDLRPASAAAESTDRG